MKNALLLFLTICTLRLGYSFGNLHIEHEKLKKSHNDLQEELLDLVRQNRDGAGLCYTMCNSFSQDYSGILGYNYGGCFCDNDEGQKMQEGYEYMLYLQEQENRK